MSSVLHFRRQLDRPPVAADVPDICVRNIKVPDDVAPWLELRDRAMSDQSPRVRPWNECDFRVEMCSKPWWRPDHTWLAISGEGHLARHGRSPDGAANNPSPPIASVTLALRKGASQTVPVVHWLLVDPAWRRRGIARMLMSHLEQAAWNAGWREIELETHTGWTAAVAFYQSTGYDPLRDRSPR